MCREQRLEAGSSGKPMKYLIRRLTMVNLPSIEHPVRYFNRHLITEHSAGRRRSRHAEFGGNVFVIFLEFCTTTNLQILEIIFNIQALFRYNVFL